MALISQQTGQFSGYQLSDLRALCLRMLRVTNTVRYSPTQGTADYDWIDDALNRGQEDFVRKTKCLKTFAVVELKANYRTYRCPEDFIDLKSAYFYNAELSDGYRQLIIKNVEEMNEEISDYRTNTGSPRHIYLDRIYGNNWMFGLNPIPDTDGDTITFSSDYGTVVQWVCPIYTYSQEYGVILRMTDTDEYFLNSDAGVVGKASSLNKNVWMEYYRLPKELNNEVQYPEVPKEYQKALTYYAAGDLLQNNPEDSAEFKRSIIYEQKFNGEVKDYNEKRKPTVSGHHTRGRVAAHTWYNNMQWYSGLP